MELNKHLMKIINEYISKDLPFTSELLDKTKYILEDTLEFRNNQNNYYVYDNTIHKHWDWNVRMKVNHTSSIIYRNNNWKVC